LSKAAGLLLFYLPWVIRWLLLLAVKVIIFKEKFSMLYLALKLAILWRFSIIFCFHLPELMAKKPVNIILVKLKILALSLSLLSFLFKVLLRQTGLSQF